MEAALKDEGWTLALDISVEMLGAQHMALGLAPKPGVGSQLFCSSAASPAFLTACGALVGRYGAQDVQTRVTETALLAWAHAPSSAERLVQDVAVFAQWAGPGEPAMLRRIALVAARAVSARRQIADMRSVLALRGAAFDRLAFGVAVVDGALYVREPNAACRAILARCDGLSLHQDRLVCRSGDDTRGVTEMVKAAIAGQSQAGGCTVRVSRARGGKPYLLTPVVAAKPGVNIKHCLLVIIDPETQIAFSPEAWGALVELNTALLVRDVEALGARQLAASASGSARATRPN
jgi:hypothetical protein